MKLPCTETDTRQPINLMFKVAHARHHHHHIVLFAELNGVVVPYGTAGLDHRSDTCRMSNAYAVVKWEESVRGHGGSFQVKIELTGLFNGVPQGVYTGGLAASFADQLLVLHQGDGV